MNDDDRIPTLTEALANMRRPTFAELLARDLAGEDITDGAPYVPPPKEKKRNPPRATLRRRPPRDFSPIEIDLFGEDELEREAPPASPAPAPGPDLRMDRVFPPTPPRDLRAPSRMPPRGKE